MSLAFSIALSVLCSIIAAELLGVCPWLTNWLIVRAAQRMPDEHGERYLAEWQGEVDYMRTRCGNLSILLWAVAVYITSNGLAEELRGASETPASRALSRIPIFNVRPRSTRNYSLDLRKVVTRFGRKAKQKPASNQARDLRRIAIRFFDAARLMFEDREASKRQNAIARIIAHHAGTPLAAIMRRLRQRGYRVNLETVLDDLLVLGAVSDGDSYYFPRTPRRASSRRKPAVSSD